MTVLRVVAVGWLGLLCLLLFGCGGQASEQQDEVVFGSAGKGLPLYVDDDQGKWIAGADGQWHGVVVHSSHSFGNSYAGLVRHHEQVLGLPGGLGYHFVIGDGTKMAAGELRVGPRWRRGQAGEALEGLDEEGWIHVCLLGESDHAAPREQLLALDELLNLLVNRFGRLRVVAHSELEDVGRACPGERLSALHWQQIGRVYGSTD